MRVLHVAHCYPPATGGSEVLMEQVSRRLVRDRHWQVKVITTTGYSTAPFRGDPAPTMAPGSDVRDGVVVERFDADPRWSKALRKVHRPLWRLHVPGNSVIRTVYDGPISIPMLRQVMREEADLIGATAFPLAHMHYAWAAARRHSVPLVLFGALHPEDAWGYDRATVRFLARHASAYVAYTPAEAQSAMEMGVQSERVHVIPPGIDPPVLDQRHGQLKDELGIPQSARVFGFVGQLGRGKGVFELVSAFAAIAAQLPDWQLLLAGAPTGDLTDLREQIALLPDATRERIVFYEGFPLERKGDVYRMLDVFVTPSYNESFGITTVEAWHCGIPVIATRLRAVSSFVRHGIDAVLVGRGDADELAGAMLELAYDEPYRSALAASGRTRAASLTWDAMARSVADLYSELVRR